MDKIPTLYVRDPDNMARVLPEPHPDCLWVFDCEGVPRRKWDGVCVRLGGATGDASGDGWWARRDVKPGKTAPPNFEHVAHDPVTGKDHGWEPLEQTGWEKYVSEAVVNWVPGHYLGPGTYELVGPKVNGNPERMDGHRLMRHDTAPVDEGLTSIQRAGALGWDEIRDRLSVLAGLGWEGVVWWHPDGRLAKIKAKDLPRD